MTGLTFKIGLQGFDGIGGAFFLKCGELKSEMQEIFPMMHFCCETNFVSDKRGEEWKSLQEQIQENSMGAEFVQVSALNKGSGVSRYRRFGTDLEIAQGYCDPGNPDDDLDLGWMSKKKPGPCLVSTLWSETQDPMMVKHEQSGAVRPISADEADRLMGYDAGISCGFGEVDISEDERLKRIGGDVCLRHYIAVLDGLDVQESVPRQVMAAEILEADPVKLEKFVRACDDSELSAWVKKMRGDFEKPKFGLNVDDDALTYKCDKMFVVQEDMADAVLAKMGSKCKKNQFEELKFTTNEDWENPMFFQMKEGRIDPLTGKQDCRILCACVYLNDKNKPENWMKGFSPTVDAFLSEFREEEDHFAKVDDYDAFECVEVKEDSLKY